MMNRIKISRGFTLIELLVVIAILGVLAVGLVSSIDPADKLNSAADSRVLSDIGVISRAGEAYSSSNSGNYPLDYPDMVGNELKSAPTPPNGYTYTQTASANLTPTAAQAACTTAGPVLCRSFVITSPLKSKKYVNATPSTPFWRYESSTGKSCAVATAATACP